MAFSPNITGAAIRQMATGISDEVERVLAKGEFFTNKLSTLTAEELTSYGLDANYQTYLGSMKSDLIALKAWYTANCAFIKQFTDLTVF